MRQAGQRPRRRVRRLITLICADRAQRLAVMVVIRRELPRTSIAGLAVRAGRIVSVEDSPFRVSLDRCPACLIVSLPS